MSDLQLDDFGLSESSCLELELKDLAHTRRLGQALAETFSGGGFIGLVGNLGAGKTTLVQSLVDTLSPGLEARSPTYTLLNHYPTEPPIIHIDLYRLETYDELESIGYWDYVESAGVLSCVEWVDRIPHAWPGEGLLIEMQRVGEDRGARLWPTAAYQSRVFDALRERLEQLERSNT